MALRGSLMLTTAAAAVLLASLASAQEQPANASAPDSWLGSIRVSGYIDAGASLNPSQPTTGINFGQLFTDKANQVVLNQFALTAERDIDPRARGFDLGFKLQGAYGMDSQFTHFLGIGDQATTARNSFDLREASLEAHLPILTPGGIDVKGGLFVSPLGYERIDPTGNVFYSKSYIFNFGLPRKSTGVLTTTHVSPLLDLYLGYDTGVNASVGYGGGYNDGQPHVLGGFGLNFERLTILALAHVGPEDPAASLPAGVDVHAQRRYIGDIVASWRITDRLTSVTEFNYIEDDGLKAAAGGVAEYLTYPLSRTLTAGLRGEVWRDDKGAFVAGYPGNLDYVDVEEGLPNTAYHAAPATYGELTAGLNIRPLHLPAMIGGLTVRPEVRYDRDLAGGPSFGGRPLTSRDQITAAVDVVVPLSFARQPGEPDWPAAGPIATAADADADEPASDAAPIQRLERARTASDEVVGAPDQAVFASTVHVRGQGAVDVQRDSLAGESLIVDGVVIGTNSGQIIDTFDLASITADPMGSNIFDGRTGEGGVIEVRRTKPTRDWGVDLEYGLEQGFHANSEKGLFNAPIGADAGLKVSVAHTGRGGYLNNVYTGDGLYGREELTTGNLQFDWSLTPKLEANLGVTLAHQDGQGNPLALGDRLAASLYGSESLYKDEGLKFNAYGSPYYPGQSVPLGAFQTANDFSESDGLTSQIYSLALDYDAGFAQVRSVTAFMRQDDKRAQDLDGGCAGSDIGGRACEVAVNPATVYLHTDTARRFDEFTQSLRATHDFGDRATLTAGLYYYRDDTTARTLTQSGQAVVSGFFPFAPLYAPTAQQSFSERNEQKSAYGDLRVDATRRLHLAAGVRYVDESARYGLAVADLGGQAAAFGLVLPAPTQGVQDSRKVLTKFSASYDIAAGQVIYADRATGFRAGGLAPGATLSEQIPGLSNYDPGNPNANYSTYRPETSTLYELGAKTSDFEGQLTAELAGFIDEISGYQEQQLVVAPGYGPGFNSYIVNLPKVEIKGVDLEVKLRPAFLAGVTLTGSGGYQDARITNGLIPAVEASVNVNGTAGTPGTPYNLTGLPLERSPDFNATVRADYARPVGPGLVDVNVGYRWTSRYSFGELAGQPDYQPAFGLLDLSVSYSRSFYTLSVAARNLLNTVYFGNALPSLFVHTWGDPRTAVVALQARF